MISRSIRSAQVARLVACIPLRLGLEWLWPLQPERPFAAGHNLKKQNKSINKKQSNNVQHKRNIEVKYVCL